MKDESRNRIYVLFTGLVMFLVLAAGAVKFVPQYNRYQKLKEQDAERDAKIRSTERKIAERKDMERRFNSDAECVKSVARENHLYHPHEVVFLFGGSDQNR